MWEFLSQAVSVWANAERQFRSELKLRAATCPASCRKLQTLIECKPLPSERIAHCIARELPHKVSQFLLSEMHSRFLKLTTSAPNISTINHFKFTKTKTQKKLKQFVAILNWIIRSLCQIYASLWPPSLMRKTLISSPRTFAEANVEYIREETREKARVLDIDCRVISQNETASDI